MADSQQINRLIQMLSQRMGAPEGEIRSAVESSNYSRLLDRMDPKRAGELESILSDENKAREFLSSPQAKAIIKRLMG